MGVEAGVAASGVGAAPEAKQVMRGRVARIELDRALKCSC